MTHQYVHVDKPFAARSFSFLWIKRIYVGRGFDRLSVEARHAAVAHEVYHLDNHHAEIRLLALLLVFPILFLRRLCHEQEYAADVYAARYFKKGLLQLLVSDQPASITHPSHADRRARISSTGPRKGPFALSA